MTQEQFEKLGAVERNLHTMYKAQWCAYPGRENLEMMLGIWNEITGQERRVDFGCGSCVTSLVSDIARLYFAYKESLPAEEEPKKKSKK